MPIIRIIKPNDNTVVGIWKITETIDDLSKLVTLSSKSKELLKKRKNSIHKLQFLSVRAILIELGYADDNLSYQDSAPILDDSKKIFRDVSNIGHWGTGDYELKISDEDNFEYIMSCIRQSYEKR